MVNKNMLRMKAFFQGRKEICDLSRSNRMLSTDQITEISPDVRTYFWVTIYYLSTIIDTFSQIILQPRIADPVEFYPDFQPSRKKTRFTSYFFRSDVK